MEIQAAQAEDESFNLARCLTRARLFVNLIAGGLDGLAPRTIGKVADKVSIARQFE